MPEDDFRAAALIGQLMGLHMMARLITKRVLSNRDAQEIMDAALLNLETLQGSFPENQHAFERAREFFDQGIRDFGATNLR